MATKRFTVRIRRDIGKAVKPEAEQLDGNQFMFRFGWVMEESDTYPGETTWLPADATWPGDAPTWIASGDLVDLEER